MERAIDLELIRSDHNPASRKTKIVCTLGPACWSVEGLANLIDRGMSVARFNFSHGDHATHAACLERLRAAVALRPGSNVAVMLGEKNFVCHVSFYCTHSSCALLNS